MGSSKLSFYVLRFFKKVLLYDVALRDAKIRFLFIFMFKCWSLRSKDFSSRSLKSSSLNSSLRPLRNNYMSMNFCLSFKCLMCGLSFVVCSGMSSSLSFFCFECLNLSIIDWNYDNLGYCYLSSYCYYWSCSFLNMNDFLIFLVVICGDYWKLLRLSGLLFESLGRMCSLENPIVR